MDAPRFFPEFVFATDVVVLDFETTGLSPARGDRAIEIGAVRILGGRLEERFSELMNPGFPVSSFITGFTGITNDMLAVAPPCGEVMTRFADFLGDSCLVAHNASFDLSFLSAELARVGRWHDPPVACTMKLARRLITDACNHRLGTLVAHCCIENDGTFHRALADADVTARLWLHLLGILKREHDLEPVPFSFIQELMTVKRDQAAAFLRRRREELLARDAAPGGSAEATPPGAQAGAGPEPAG
jgi:DNA polymerase-3 subunit epsilon